MSTDPTWRVYLAEWVTVYTSDMFVRFGDDECEAVFGQRYKGRVRDGDWRVIPVTAGHPEAVVPRVLQLRLPNLRGEFKSEADAWWLAGELLDATGQSPHVVQRGSAEERALLEYGKKMLPGGGTGS
jgi:hypothetical protein